MFRKVVNLANMRWVKKMCAHWEIQERFLG